VLKLDDAEIFKILVMTVLSAVYAEEFSYFRPFVWKTSRMLRKFNSYSLQPPSVLFQLTVQLFQF